METVRRRISDFIRTGPKSLREISQELRISEKDALEHLGHIVKARARLEVEPAECLACGYVFTKRRRLGPPGRCPVCRSEHISEPLYTIKD